MLNNLPHRVVVEIKEEGSTTHVILRFLEEVWNHDAIIMLTQK